LSSISKVIGTLIEGFVSITPLELKMKEKEEVQMLQICLGIYIVIALLTFLIFLGTFFEAQNPDEKVPERI
jgi:hypothetical protein